MLIDHILAMLVILLICWGFVDGKKDEKKTTAKSEYEELAHQIEKIQTPSELTQLKRRVQLFREKYRDHPGLTSALYAELNNQEATLKNRNQANFS